MLSHISRYFGATLIFTACGSYQPSTQHLNGEIKTHKERKGLRNGYMLHQDLGKRFGIRTNPLFHRGYDWWWHSLVAVNRLTGEEQPFFIEYYVINPGKGGDKPILGQSQYAKENNLKPSYAMLKAGTWKKNASVQINNFYPISEFYAEKDRMDVRIGENYATEEELVGSVSLTQEEAEAHPEYMSEYGEMSWDITAKKVLSYSAGFAASRLMTSLNAMSMWWHIPGMKTLYEGEIIYNGQVFDVIPERSYGYQDKNWGTDYTNPWVWLNCNNFVDAQTGQPLPLTSLDVGGGVPRAFNIPLGKKVLVIFYHEGKLYEFNFAKPLLRTKTQFDVQVGAKEITWHITAENKYAKIDIAFKNAKDKMLKMNYENPDGEKNHDMLWNGGHAEGTVKLYQKTLRGLKLVGEFYGKNGGSEYGEY